MDKIKDILLRVDQGHISQSILLFFDNENIQFVKNKSQTPKIRLTDEQVIREMVDVYRKFLMMKTVSGIRAIVTKLNATTINALRGKVYSSFVHNKFKTESEKNKAICPYPTCSRPSYGR
jgi:hypothetical protein